MHRAEQLGEVLAPGPAFGQVQGEAAGGAGQAGGHDAIRAATPKAQVAGPVLDGRAHTFAFGDELDVRPIRGADFNGQQELTDRAVAAYIAKYATKGAETATGALDRPIRLIAEVAHLDITDHARRLIRTARGSGVASGLFASCPRVAFRLVIPVRTASCVRLR